MPRPLTNGALVKMASRNHPVMCPPPFKTIEVVSPQTFERRSAGKMECFFRNYVSAARLLKQYQSFNYDFDIRIRESFACRARALSSASAVSGAGPRGAFESGLRKTAHLPRLLHLPVSSAGFAAANGFGGSPGSARS